MENKSDTPKQYTYLPFQLTRILDSHCYKVLSILMNLRNIRGKEDIDVPQSKLSEFSGLSESTIKTTLKVLKNNNFIDVIPSTSFFNDHTQTYVNVPNKYIIRDSVLKEWEEKEWKEVKEIQQIKISNYSKPKKIEHRQRKPLKGELIFPIVDVNRTAEENMRMLNEMNIDVKRATVSNVLKLKRENLSGNKITPQEKDSMINSSIQVEPLQESIIEDISASNINVHFNHHESGKPTKEFILGSGGSYLFGNKSKWNLNEEELREEYIFRFENKLPLNPYWVNLVKSKCMDGSFKK